MDYTVLSIPDKTHGGELYLHLRQRRRLYRKRTGAMTGGSGFRNRVSISELPSEAATRLNESATGKATLCMQGSNLRHVGWIGKSGYLAPYPVKRQNAPPGDAGH